MKISEKINEEWINKNCYIAGGACVSNATRQPIHDIDIYFKTKEARDLFISEISEERYFSKSSNEWKALIMYDSLLENGVIEIGDEKNFTDLECLISSEKFRDAIVFNLKNKYDDYTIPKPLFEKQKWMLSNGYDYVLLERNHFSVEDNEFLGNKSITIIRNDMFYQFILRFYGDPQKMMDETFDFQHCKIAYDLEINEYITTQETWEALSKRELHYVNSFYPISSLKRLYKYGNRGFKWNNNEFVKIIRDIHKVDVENKFVLEDQLIGYYEDFDYNIVFSKENELFNNDNTRQN